MLCVLRCVVLSFVVDVIVVVLWFKLLRCCGVQITLNSHARPELAITLSQPTLPPPVHTRRTSGTVPTMMGYCPRCGIPTSRTTTGSSHLSSELPTQGCLVHCGSSHQSSTTPHHAGSTALEAISQSASGQVSGEVGPVGGCTSLGSRHHISQIRSKRLVYVSSESDSVKDPNLAP